MLTLSAVKANLRVVHTDEDDFITSLRDAALRYIERYTGLVYVERTQAFRFDRFTPALRLNLRPVDTATISLTYLDTSGEEQTFSDIRTTDRDGFTLIVPAVGYSWPTALDEPGAVTVEATVGSDALEADVQQAALVLVAHWYENRDGSGAMSEAVQAAVASLLNAHRDVRV